MSASESMSFFPFDMSFFPFPPLEAGAPDSMNVGVAVAPPANPDGEPLTDGESDTEGAAVDSCKKRTPPRRWASTAPRVNSNKAAFTFMVMMIVLVV